MNFPTQNLREAVAKPSWRGRWLLFAVLAVLVAPVLRGAAPAPLKSPSDEGWEAYFRVEEARTGKNPELVISEPDLRAWLKAKNFIERGKGDYDFDRFRVNYGAPYHAGDVKRFVDLPPVSANLPKLPPPGWQKPQLRLRESASDVLSIEDPSQTISPDRRVNDLKGALFSYTRDRRASTDTWSAKGALILPLLYRSGATPNLEDWQLISAGFVPSVSIDRVSTEERGGAKATAELDQLAYRLGVFGKWSVPGHVVDTMTVRGYATCVTDTGHEAAIPTAQLEWEPQAFLRPGWAIGYVQNAWPKKVDIKPVGTDWTDDSYLAYQLRLRLHADYGKVLTAGPTGAREEEFLRVGPLVELRLAPLLVQPLSLTLAYQYLPALVGSNEHHSLYKADAEYVVWTDKNEKSRTVSLKANYTRGGVEITKKQVDSFQFGLGGTF